MNESVHFDAWLVSVLEADVGAGGLFEPAVQPGVGARVGGVWSEVIPPRAVLPAIRFTDLAPADVNGLSGTRILTTGLYQVVVTGQAKDYGPLVAAADRLDEVLQGAAGLHSPVWVLSCVRESSFKQAELDGDTQFRHLGGVYRVQGHRE